MSVKRQVILNGIAGLFSKTVRIADQLFLVPFFLSSWGAAYYGEWLTLSIIPSVLAFADFGLGTASSNKIVLSYSAGKKQECADWYETGFRVISISVLIGFFLCAIVMLIAWFTNILEKSLISPVDAIWAVIFLMGSRLVSFYLQLFEGFYRSVHKAALSINIMTIEGFLKIGIGMVVLLSGLGVVTYSLSMFIIAILFNIVYALYGKSLVGDLPSGKWNRFYALETAKKGLAFLVSPVWQSIYYQGSTFIVRIVLGPEAVALFNTLRTLSRSVNQLYSSISGAVMPELQIAIGEKKDALSQQLFVNSIRVSFVFACAGVIIMALFGLSLYNWWTQGQLEVTYPVWIIFLIGIIFNSLWYTASIIFRAQNEPYKFAIYSLFSALVSVLITYLLSSLYGILGAVVGYVFLDVLMFILAFPAAYKMLNLNWKSFV